MAFVKTLVPDKHQFRGLHPTHVECRYVVGERDGRKILQLNTYGSAHREIPGKLSQTLQFDEASARELWSILSKHFGFR